MTNKYYQKHKERLRKEAREKRQNLSEEVKNKRRVSRKISKSYRRRRRKKKIVEYSKNYYLTHKNNYLAT